MKTLLITAFLIVVLLVCEAQPKDAMVSLVASDLKFRSTLGFKPADSQNVFSLLGRGFYGTRKSEHADSLIRAWVKSHPGATVVPVTSLSQARIADKNATMIYCWIIDSGDTLNNYLIRNGCFPGAAMSKPATWEEMTNQERENYKNSQEPVVSVHVDASDYDIFLRQIGTAEKFAKKNDLGIWNDENK